MKKTTSLLTLTVLLCVSGSAQAQILKDAWKELKKAVTIDNGNSKQSSTNKSANQTGSEPVHFTNLKAYGDPATGILSFKVDATRTAKSAYAISLGVLSVTDDKGNTIPSYTRDNKNALPWYPITDNLATKITIRGNESVVVNPDVRMLKKVVLCGSNGDRWPGELATFNNVPIEWEPRDPHPACWPAEHYLSRRHVFEGTPVIEHTGFIETAKEGDWDGIKYAINHGTFIHLSGIVGNRKTGEVRIIIKFYGSMSMNSSETKFFDEDGNMYEQKSDVFLPSGVSSTSYFTELVSKPFKVPTSVKRIQKLTISCWSFTDIPIQWVEL